MHLYNHESILYSVFEHTCIHDYLYNIRFNYNIRFRENQLDMKNQNITTSPSQPSPEDHTPSSRTTESSPIDITIETPVEIESNKDTVVTSDVDQTGVSGNDQDIMSEATLSTGTPSTVYNPKDSDSMVPMHLLGSYSESMEGEFVVMDVAPPIANESDNDGKTNGDHVVDGLASNMEGISEEFTEDTELNNSKQVYNGTTDDSDTRVLV